MTEAEADILELTRPEDLFPADLAAAKRRYRELSRRWHPDTPDGSHEVFTHISELYRQAVERLTKNQWDGAAVVRFTLADGRTLAMHALANAPFVLGRSIVSPRAVTFLVESGYRSMVEHAAQVRFSYASDRMRTEVARYLPVFRPPVTTATGDQIVQVGKTTDLIRLRDVVTHMGQLDAKHVAWITSSLLNLCCYLSFNGIVHHDISPDTYFVSPSLHSGALLGGWWYWGLRGEQVSVVPKRTFDLMPFTAKARKVASAQTDLELVRATALECLSAAPGPMRTWLTTPNSASAVEQYREWQRVLKDTFGARRFLQMDLTADEVYGKAVVHG